MVDVAALGIRVDASSADGAGSALARLRQQASGAEAGINLLKRAFQGLTVGAVVGKLVSTQRQFDVLNASLVTVTGSSKAAEREFAWIKDFAATTPFALNEVTTAFVKLKALGLDATRETLTSYGNTASAFGKSLEQFIEAVADASTGEFERLKEFGIKARQDGETVSLTFQGITKTIGNNAAEITRYLDEIGNNQFAGAMQRRAESLDGALSNLGDTWDELFRTVNQNATGSVIFDSVKLASSAIQDAITILDAMNDATAENSRQTGAMKAIQEGVAAVFETVAVVGANVAYVFKATGRELGGLAAQAVALARLDFRGFNSIGAAMKEDAEAARAEVDKLSTSILTARARASQDAANKEFGESLFGGSIDQFVANATPRKGTPTGGGTQSKSAAADARREAQRENELRLLAAEQVLGTDDAQLRFNADVERAYADFDRTRKAANDEAIRQANAQEEAVGSLAERYRDLADPTRQYRQEIQLVTALEAQGRLTAEEAFNARLRLVEQEESALERTTKQLKDQKSVVEQLGLTFTSALEDAIVNFKSLGDVARGVLQDIARMLVRESITAPLAKSFKDSGIGSSIGSFFSGLFKFAGGGYVSGAGTATSDSIPARLSNGEFVVRADSVRKVGVSTLNAINDSGYVPRRFAAGGLVTGAGAAVQPGATQTVQANFYLSPGTSIDDFRRSKRQIESDLARTVRRAAA